MATSRALAVRASARPLIRAGLTSFRAICPAIWSATPKATRS